MTTIKCIYTIRFWNGTYQGGIRTIVCESRNGTQHICLTHIKEYVSMLWSSWVDSYLWKIEVDTVKYRKYTIYSYLLLPILVYSYLFLAVLIYCYLFIFFSNLYCMCEFYTYLHTYIHTYLCVYEFMSISISISSIFWCVHLLLSCLRRQCPCHSGRWTKDKHNESDQWNHKALPESHFAYLDFCKNLQDLVFPRKPYLEAKLPCHFEGVKISENQRRSGPLSYGWDMLRQPSQNYCDFADQNLDPPVNMKIVDIAGSYGCSSRER